MTNDPIAGPPVSAHGELVRHHLEEDTRLYRVHDRKYRPEAFKAQVDQILFGGSRFGGTELDRFPFLYAALDPATAVLETLLHDVTFDGRPERLIPRGAIEDLILSPLLLTVPVDLVSLMDARALSSVGADSWLVHCERPAYPKTRWWAKWIRSQSDWSKGLIWPSKRDLGGTALVLFGDRFDRECGIPAKIDYRPVVMPDLAAESIDFGTEDGFKWLVETLKPFHTSIAEPKKSADSS